MTGTVDNDEQRRRRRRHGAIETAASEMWQKGETMGKTKEMWDDKGDRGYGRNHICGTTGMAVLETREDKIRHNRQEKLDSVPLGRTAAAASMDLSLSPTE